MDTASAWLLGGVCRAGGAAPPLAGAVAVSVLTKVGNDAARAPRQRHELVERVRDWIRMSPAFGEHDPYRAELFGLCQANRDVGGNQLADALRGQLPETTLHRLVLVWNAWRYALERV